MKYQSSSTHCSKVISKVKVSEMRTELQNDRQDKNNMPPDLRSRGHKNVSEFKINFIYRGYTVILEINNIIQDALVSHDRNRALYDCEK